MIDNSNNNASINNNVNNNNNSNLVFMSDNNNINPIFFNNNNMYNTTNDVSNACQITPLYYELKFCLLSIKCMHEKKTFFDLNC